MSLLKKLMASSTIDISDVLSESKIFNNKDLIPTPIPMINVALSGSLDGGLSPGLHTFAGPSKHFKTGFALLCASAYLNYHKDSIMLFYDSEFGTPQAYFDTFGIDTNRVLHTPIKNIEQLKVDIMNQLDNIEEKDKVVIVIDSIGNLASKKEVDDAMEGKSVADMTRAKQLKSLWRMVTPNLTIKDIPIIAVNHTYKTMEMFSKDVVSGGTGTVYSSDTIWILGRQQDKDGKEIQGYNFVINVDKSRHTKEKSKIFINVNHKHGINKYSGLLECAIDLGAVIKPSNGWYSRVDLKTGEPEEKKWRSKDTNTSEFWSDFLNDDVFKQRIKEKYKIGHGNIMQLEDE